MKIIQINSTANKGSTGRIAEQIGLAVIEQGWESIIAYGRDHNTSQNRLYRIGNPFAVMRHGITSILFGKHGDSSYFATKKLIQFIEKEQPNIIHLHNIHGYYLHYPLFFKYLANSDIPVVWTLHDCWSFTGHCAYFSDIQCEKWKTLCVQCPKKMFYPKSYLFDTSSYYYQLKKEVFNSLKIQLVTVSEWLKGKVEQSFLQQHKVRFIWNGVDEKKFIIQAKNEALLKKYKLKNRRILLAASTSWSKQKGFDDYVKLAHFLKEEVIVLIGLPYHMRLQLPHNIIAVDRTESVEELASWYATADVILNLSNQETFGLTNVEAFMCGKPVVAYNTTASPEIVSNELVGRIVDYGNISALSKAIKELLSTHIEAQQIRAYAVENFALNKQIGAYIDLYRSLLSNNNKPLL